MPLQPLWQRLSVIVYVCVCACVCCTLISCAHSYVLIWLYDFICVHIFCRLFWRFILKTFIVSYVSLCCHYYPSPASAASPTLPSKQQFLFKVLKMQKLLKFSICCRSFLLVLHLNQLHVMQTRRYKYIDTHAYKYTCKYKYSYIRDSPRHRQRISLYAIASWRR